MTDDETKKQIAALTWELLDIKSKLRELHEQNQRQELVIHGILRLFSDMTVVVEEGQGDGRTSAPSGMVS